MYVALQDCDMVSEKLVADAFIRKSISYKSVTLVYSSLIDLFDDLSGLPNGLPV